MLNVTLNVNSVGNCNRRKFNVHVFSSIFTVLANGVNDNETVLKESQNNFDRHIENGSYIIYSMGDNMRISQIQKSPVMSD